MKKIIICLIVIILLHIVAFIIAQSIKNKILVIPIDMSVVSPTSGIANYYRFDNRIFNITVELDQPQIIDECFLSELNNSNLIIEVLDLDSREISYTRNEKCAGYEKFQGRIISLSYQFRQALNVHKGNYIMNVKAEPAIKRLSGVKQLMNVEYSFFDLELVEILFCRIGLVVCYLLLFVLICIYRKRNTRTSQISVSRR